MDAPEDTPPFRRLRHILTRRRRDDEREAARQTMSPDFERVALSIGWPAAKRLAALATLARLAPGAALPDRDREIVVHELNRMALRILWWEGFLGPGMAQEAPPDVAAAALVEFCAGGLMPEGPAGCMVLDRAKALLQRADVAQRLREDVPRRDRLLRLLAEAEARSRPLQL